MLGGTGIKNLCSQKMLGEVGIKKLNILGGFGMNKLFPLKKLEGDGIKKLLWFLCWTHEADMKGLFSINMLGGAATKKLIY